MSQIAEIQTPVDTEKRQKLNIRAGDTVRVSLRIEEKGKTRLQVFEGIVLARKHGGEAGGTFTVRRTAGGVGVEKIFPLYSPVIEKIEVVRRAKVRQSNLYHIRKKVAKQVRRHLKNMKVVSETDVEQKSSRDDLQKEASEETDADTPTDADTENETVQKEESVGSEDTGAEEVEGEAKEETVSQKEAQK